MLFGYADESGEPGIKKNEHDYFVVCIVLFKNRQDALKCSDAIGAFRIKQSSSDRHEFHFVTDSKKTKPAFIKFISKLDFKFISVSIKKDYLHGTASYKNMAELILELIEKKQMNANINIDKNPALYKELRSRKKKYSVELHFAEKESRGNNLIQLADYVTALRTRYLKYPYKTNVNEGYSKISKKLIGSFEL